MSNYDTQEYNYENDYLEAKKEIERCEDAYKSAGLEIRRLRGVASEYTEFYKKVKEAYEQQDWDAVKAAIDWSDDKI